MNFELFKRRLKFVIFTAAVLGAIAGTWNTHNAALGRATIMFLWAWSAYVWMVSVIVVLASLAGHLDLVKAKARAGELNRSVPAWFSIATDLLIACLCAALGWRVTALLWISQQIPENVIFGGLTKAGSTKAK